MIYSGEEVLFGQSGCIRAESGCMWKKSSFIRQKWFHLGNVVVFGNQYCVWAKVVVFEQSGCILAKAVVIWQK